MKPLKLFLVFVILIKPCSSRAQDIFEAIAGNNIEALKSIIEKDPNTVNLKNSNGWTPLYAACQNEVHIGLLQYLVENGADVNAADNFGLHPCTALPF